MTTNSHYTATIKNGQIVISEEDQERYNLHDGDQVTVEPIRPKEAYQHAADVNDAVLDDEETQRRYREEKRLIEVGIAWETWLVLQQDQPLRLPKPEPGASQDELDIIAFAYADEMMSRLERGEGIVHATAGVFAEYAPRTPLDPASIRASAEAAIADEAAQTLEWKE